MSGMILPQVAAIGENVYSLSFDNKYTTKSGTSMACPFVSGVAGLVYERYKELYGADPISALAKAFICNGANDIFLPGPDFGTGFGEVNVPNTMEMVEKKQFIVDSILSTGNVKEYLVTIPQGTNEMKVMLAWNDPMAVPEAMGKTLINNLDIEVVYDRTYLPLVPDPMQPDKPAVERVDNLNNILQVVLKAPAAGKARIRIKGTSVPVPSQQFAVVYSFAKKGITLLTPVTGRPIITGENLLIKWKSVGLSGPVTVEFSKDGGESYTTFGTTLQNLNYLVLPVAEQATEKFRLRISQDGHFFETGDMAVLAQVKNLKQTLGVDNSTLSWNAVAGVSEYEILRLKDDNATYEVVATTDQLNYTLTAGLCPKRTYFTVRAKLGTGVGERAIAVAVDPIKALSNFPIHIDFDKQIPEEMRLKSAPYSEVRYQYIPEHKRRVLMYEGKIDYYANPAVYSEEWASPSAPIGVDTVLNKIFDYPGTYTFKRSQQTGTQTTSITGKSKFLSTARLSVDLPAGKNIIMKVKVRVLSTRPDQLNVTVPNPENQTHHSLFRVRVNGVAQTSADGNIVQVRPFRDFTPQYEYYPINIRQRTDVDRTIFEDKYYNLTRFAGQRVDIDFDAICATARRMNNIDGEGSQVYIASIDIEEQKPYEMVVTRLDSAKRGTTAFNWSTLGLTVGDLVGEAKTKTVYARVANIGYMPSAGTVTLDLARYAAKDTVRGASVTTPVLQPFTAQFVTMDNVQFSYPEGHNLLFRVKPENSTSQPEISYIEYNVDSYELNTSVFRMSTGGQSTAFQVGLREPVTRFTDYGSTIYPYLRYAGYNYPYTFATDDKAKRVQLKLKNVDLMAGDTMYIKSSGQLLGKLGGKITHDTTFVSTAPNGSINFSVVIDPTQEASIATAGGWEGEVSLVDRAIQRDVAIIGPVFERPQTFSNGTRVSLVVENRGAQTVSLSDFRPSYKYGSMAKVVESAPYYVSYSSTFGAGASQMFVLEPGDQALMSFTQPLIGDTSIHVNQFYDMTFVLEGLVDENMSNNEMSRKLRYGDGEAADDFGPNAYVQHFEMAGVSRTSETYGFQDFTNQVIRVNLGEGYPYSLIINGRQSKSLEGVFIPDYNGNRVFEETEVIALDNDGSENHNTYTGTFWPHMYFSQAGDYRFRVAAYQNGNMSAWEFILRVEGTPVNRDVELRNATMAGSKLIASSIGELTMDVVAEGYATPVAGTLDIAYVNAGGTTVFSRTLPTASIGDGRQTVVATIPVPDDVPDGEYTLNVLLNADDPVTTNNKQSLHVTIAREIILYTSTAKGRVAYVSPKTDPASAGRQKAKLPPFKVSNMFHSAWVTDDAKNIDNWYLLSEQFTRTIASESKTFYDNRLVKFNFDDATQVGSYDTLATKFTTENIAAIAFNPKSKTLYGLGANGADLAIYTIDYETGAATLSHTFAGIAAGEFAGLAVDLGDNLYSVRNRNEVVILNRGDNKVNHFADVTTTIPNGRKVNMAYDFGEGILLLAFQNADNVGQLYEVMPAENKLNLIAPFGTTNQSYSLGLASVTNPAVDTLFRLDRFDVAGQLHSLLDNTTKSVTIVVPSTADKSSLTLDNYSFANNNAKFQKEGVDVPTTGATLDLSSPQTFTALKTDGTTATWTIRAEDAMSTGVKILEFRFLQVNNPALTADVQATIDGTIITATVPSNVDITKLVPFIKTNVPVEDERLMIGETRILSQSSKVDFSSPLLLEVKAQQLNMNTTYQVTVAREASTAKELLSFAFTAGLNTAQLDNDVVMQNDNGRLTMMFPRAADRSRLIPVFTVSEYATVVYNGQNVASAIDAINASASQITVTVVAEDGSTADYTIDMLAESADAKLTAFNLLTNDNPYLAASINGVIDEAGKQVSLVIPVAANRTALVPSFAMSEGATLVFGNTGGTINPGDALNFTSPFEVKVIAANGVAYTTYKVMPYVMEEGESIGLQPNPAETYTMLTGATGSTAYLYDAAGRLLRTITVTSDAQHIDLSGLAGGAYYFRIVKNGELNTIMLLKK